MRLDATRHARERGWTWMQGEQQLSADLQTGCQCIEVQMVSQFAWSSEMGKQPGGPDTRGSLCGGSFWKTCSGCCARSRATLSQASSGPCSSLICLGVAPPGTFPSAECQQLLPPQCLPQGNRPIVKYMQAVVCCPLHDDPARSL